MYGLVIFEVIVAMVISTNPPFISGIWSLAPTSTMARLRLQRAATKSSLPVKTITERQKRCSKGQTGTARDKTGPAMDKTGTTRDKTGTTRDKTGTAREKTGTGT